MGACSTYHRPTIYLLAVKQEAYQKASLLIQNMEEFFGEKKKSQENGPVDRRKKKDQTERAVRVGRRTRQRIVKWNQMTVLRFQTGAEGRKRMKNSAKETVF